MEILQAVWKQHLRPRAVVGLGVKIFLPSPPNYVTRSPGYILHNKSLMPLIGGASELSECQRSDSRSEHSEKVVSPYMGTILTDTSNRKF